MNKISNYLKTFAVKNWHYPVAVCAECGNGVNASQIARKAKFCCPACRVKNYNKMHPERKEIILKDNNLKH